MSDEPQGGRRDYDPTTPVVRALVDALEERLLRAMEKGMAETRHTLREDIGVLSTQVSANTIQQQRLQDQLGVVTEKVGEVPQLRTRVEALENADRAEHAVAEALDRVRGQAVDNKRQIRTWGISIVAIMLGFLTPITVAILSHH